MQIRLHPACLALLAMTLAPSAQAQRYTASVGAASDYVLHGVSRSLSGPVLQGDLAFQVGNRWSLGVSASTMNLNPGPGPSRELGLWAGGSRALGRDWSLAGSVYAWRYAAQIPGLPYDYEELRLELGWRERLRLGLAVAPDYSVRTRVGVAYEATSLDLSLGLQQPLSRAWSLTAGLGHFEVGGALDRGYLYWSAGLLYTGTRFSASLGYAGSQDETRVMFGSRSTGDRVIATVSLRLR